MATVNPKLLIDIEVDKSQIRQDFQKVLEQEAVAAAKKTEQRVADVRAIEEAKGEARLAQKRKEHELRKEQEAERALQRQRQKWLDYQNKQELDQQRAHDKILKGQQSWSAKMTKSLDGISVAVKGFAAAWVTAKVTNIARDSLNFAGGMADAAAGVNLTTQEFYALTSALRDAGVQAEKIDPMITRLSELASGGASPTQQTVLDRLGINAVGMSNLKLMDTLLGLINKRMITQAELGELVGNRLVPSWNRLAHEISNVNEANARYKIPLTDAEIETIDRAARAWDTMFANIKLGAASATVEIANLWSFLRNPPEPGAPSPISIEEWQRHGFLGGTPFPLVGSGLRGSRTPPPPPPPPPPQSVRVTRITPTSPEGLRPTFADIPADMSESIARMKQIEELTNDWNTQLFLAQTRTEEIPTTLEMIAQKMQEIANSNTWQIASEGVRTFTSVLDFQSAALQNQIQIMQQIGQMEQDRWDERAERMREAGLQTSALYRNELREFERSEKERNKATRRLQAKQFEIDKRSRIAGTIMATSEGFMNVFTNPRMPIGLAWVMAALVAAQGAIQIATIAGQQNPYRGFQFGGLVPGGSLGDDNLVRVRGGEYVTTPEATARNRAALEYANSGGTIQPGGASGLTVIIQGNVIGEDTYVRNNLMPAIAKAVRQGYQLQTTASR